MQQAIFLLILVLHLVVLALIFSLSEAGWVQMVRRLTDIFLGLGLMLVCLEMAIPAYRRPTVFQPATKTRSVSEGQK